MNKHVNLDARGSGQLGDDSDMVLKGVGKWRIARAKQQLFWSEHHDEDAVEPDTTELSRMRDIEEELKELRPTKVRAVLALLNVAVEILAYQKRDPEATMAQGPVLELVRNAMDGLEWLPEDMPLNASSLSSLLRNEHPMWAENAGERGAGADVWTAFRDLESTISFAVSTAKAAAMLLDGRAMDCDEVGAVSMVADQVYDHAKRAETEASALHAALFSLRPPKFPLAQEVT